MKYIILFLVFVSTVLAGQIEPKEASEIKIACATMSSAVLGNRHEEVADMMYPELVKQFGGKERLVTTLRQEEEKNRKANVVIHSFTLVPRAEFFDGHRYRVVFVESVMVIEAYGTKIKSTSFQIAFRELDSSRWYLMDGTRLNSAQFYTVFSGLPKGLELPKVTKEKE
jgi:hypothetical protein